MKLFSCYEKRLHSPFLPLHRQDKEVWGSGLNQHTANVPNRKAPKVRNRLQRAQKPSLLGSCRASLENLNLRGGFKANIMDYIKSHYPHLIPLYEEIYLHKDRTYWKQLEQEAAKMAQEAQCKYVYNKKYAHSPKEFYSRASSSIGYK